MAMSEHQDWDEAALEAAFGEARAKPAPLPDAFMARVLADAEGEIRQRQSAPLQPRTGFNPLRSLAALLAALGGWGGLGGLAAASAAGIWIGFTGVGGLAPAVQSLWGEADAGYVELMPEADFALALGLEQEG